MKTLMTCFLSMVITGSITAKTTINCAANYLFIGFDNRVEIVSNDVKPGDVTIKIMGKDSAYARVFGDSGMYKIILLNSIPKETKLRIAVFTKSNNQAKSKPLAEKTFEVRVFPKARAAFKGFEKNNEMTADEMMKSPLQLTATESGLPIDFFTVTKFSMKLTINGTSIYRENTGPNLDHKMRQVLEQVAPGDQISIYNIEGKSPNGNLKIEPITIIKK